MTLRFGSVCSGIEAASTAWNPLGWEAAWLSEIEPFPSAVLAHHYPDVPNLGDMTLLPDRIANGEVEAPDLFCGGTPCQAFSVAGLRKSLDDARGNLSLVFCEIANAIDTQRAGRNQPPAIIFWENVPGVLSTKDNAFGCFLAGLAGEEDPVEPPRGKWTNSGVVLGPQRAVAWRILDAQYFGVAQRRRRVFVVASARDDFDPASVLLEFDGMRRDSAPSREARKEAAASAGAGAEFGGMSPVAGTLTANTGGMTRPAGNANELDFCVPVTCMAHGQGGAEIAEDRSPTLTCNHEAPIAAYTTKLHNTQSNQAGKVYEEYATSLDANSPPPAVFQPIAFSAKDHGADATADLSPTLRAMNHADSHANGGGQMAVMQPITFSSVQSNQGINADLDVSQTLEAKNPMAVAHVVGALACNTGPNGHDAGNFACNQAVDAGHVLPVAQPVNIYGGNKRPDRPEGGFYVRMDEDTTKTLDAASGLNPTCAQGGTAVMQPIGLDEEQNAMIDAFGTLKARTAGGGFEGSVMQTNMAVRRLTPVECERLQGFPDDYTQIPWRKKPADECPDGPRYKALGNSWAVPVVAWIGRRIHNAVLAAKRMEKEAA
jgi:DNA (cytosine-5)-methyltransferase 1